MTLGTIFYLYRVRLRARLVQELLAVAGIAVGVALLFASQVANTSLTGSVSELAKGLVGKSQLQVTGRDPLGFSQGLVARAQALPHVSAAVPLLQRSVNLVGATGSASVDLIGVSPAVTQLNGRLDRQILRRVSQLQLPHQQGVVLPAPLARRVGVAVLQPLSLQVGGRDDRTVAAAVLQESDLGELVNSPVVIAPLSASQQLTGMQRRINRMIVMSAPGYGVSVERELAQLTKGRLNITDAGSEVSIFERAEAPVSQSTELFSVISALVGFIFAFNAMLLTLPRRRSLIADLRLDGYPPFEIVEIMFFDAVVLGVVGSAFGLLLGEILSSRLLQTNPGYLSFAFPVAAIRIVTWKSVALACLGGVLAAVVGLAVPLRNDIFPKEPVGCASLPGRRSIGAFLAPVCVVVGLAIVALELLRGISSVATAIFVFACLTISMLASLPGSFRLAIASFELIQRPMRSVSPRIAVIELQSRSTRARSLAITATGAIAVFGSVSIEGARQNLESGLDGVARETTRAADIWVAPSGDANTLATTPFSAPGLRRAFAGIAGVSNVRSYRGGFLDVGTRRILAIAEPVSSALLLAPGQVVHGAPDRGRQLLRAGGWAAMSAALANELHLRIGQRFTMPTPRPSGFRLAAVTTNFGWPPGAIIVNASDFANAWGSTDVSAYQIDIKRGASLDGVQRSIERVLGRESGLSVQTGEQREVSYRSTLSQGLSRLRDITELVLTAAVLAMAATMGAMIWQRRPRLAGMKVDGFDRAELWRALLYESAVLLATGCATGAVYGLIGQLVLGHALEGITGFPVVVAVGGVVAAVTVASVTIVAVVIVALPGYLAAQVRPTVQD